MVKKVAIVITVIVVVLVLSVAMFISYRNLFIIKSSEESPGYVVVTDFVNRTVRIVKDIRRVVAIGPGALRLVVYLNALDMVVGVEEIEQSGSVVGRDYAMAYGDLLKNLTVVGPGGPRSAPDPEKIRSVKPDLVIMSRTYVDLYNPDRLSEEVGAPVIVVDYGLFQSS